MILSPRRKFGFVHIQKTGGQSVERAYDTVARWDDVLLGGTKYAEAVSRAYRPRFGLGKHSTAAQAREVVGPAWDTWYTFGVVRDPVARVVSFYRYLAKLRKRAGRREELAARLGRPREWVSTWGIMKAHRATSDFSGWIRHPDAKPALVPQASFLFDASGRSLVTDIFLLEELNARWTEVCARLELGAIPLPHDNASDGIPKPTVTPADREWIEAACRVDYERFGFARR